MDKDELFVKVALNAWDTQITRLTQFISSLKDEELMKEIAPHKNRGIYLVGHLIAVHDAMNEILGLGPREHTSLDEAFLKNPDQSGLEMPSLTSLRQKWTAVHEKLSTQFKNMQPNDWFRRHNSITDEDFAKEPARNKMSVLMTRTNHAAYHFGQLRLLK